jgi:hypothetical protein
MIEILKSYVELIILKTDLMLVAWASI